MPLMTPHRNMILEKVLRKVGLKTTPLFFKDFTLWMTDEKYSKTLEIVYSEWADGFYNPPLDLRPGDIVIDIGAHVGLFSIPLAKKYPKVLFICYEPNPINYDNLCKNVFRNNTLQNMMIFKVGLWSHETTIDTIHDTNNTGSSTSEENKNGMIHALPIRKLLKDKVRLLKLDCEGPERFVSLTDLKGVESLLGEVHNGNKDKLYELANHPYSRLCEPGPNSPVFGTSQITRKQTKQLPL